MIFKNLTYILIASALSINSGCFKTITDSEPPPGPPDTKPVPPAIKLEDVKTIGDLFAYVFKLDDGEEVTRALDHYNKIATKKLDLTYLLELLVENNRNKEKGPVLGDAPGHYSLMNQVISLETEIKCPTVGESSYPNQLVFERLLRATALDDSNQDKIINSCIKLNEDWQSQFAEWASRNPRYFLSSKGYLAKVISSVDKNAAKKIIEKYLSGLIGSLGTEAFQFINKNKQALGLEKFIKGEKNINITFERKNLVGDFESLKNQVQNTINDIETVKNIYEVASNNIKAVDEQDNKIANLSSFDGIAGLKWYCNTCYFNAVTQALFHTTSLNKLLNAPLKNAPLSPSIVIGESYFSIMHETFSGYKTAAENNKIADPKKLVDARQTFMPQFEEGAQEDAQEFIQAVFKVLGDEFKTTQIPNEEQPNKEYFQGFESKKILKYAEQYSIIDKWFGFFVRNIRRYPEFNNYQSITYDYRHDLQLSLPEQETSVSLQRLINDYGKETVEENAFGGPKNFNMMDTAAIMEAPQYLMVTLKRYNNFGRKISTPMSFEERLKLTTVNESDVNYSLYAIITQSGGTGGGHYWANVKTSKGWFKANDSTITPWFNNKESPTTPSSGFSQMRSDTEETSGAYIFFFERLKN